MKEVGTCRANMKTSHTHVWILRPMIVCKSSAAFVLQHVEGPLVLGLENHDEMMGGDHSTALLICLTHEDVVQTSSDVGALLAKDDNLCAHGFASLLDSKVTFLVDIDYGDGDIHATSSRYSGDDRSSDHKVAGTVVALRGSLPFAFLLTQRRRVLQRYRSCGSGWCCRGWRNGCGGKLLGSKFVMTNKAICC